MTPTAPTYHYRLTVNMGESPLAIHSLEPPSALRQDSKSEIAPVMQTYMRKHKCTCQCKSTNNVLCGTAHGLTSDMQPAPVHWHFVSCPDGSCVVKRKMDNSTGCLMLMPQTSIGFAQLKLRYQHAQLRMPVSVVFI